MENWIQSMNRCTGPVPGPLPFCAVNGLVRPGAMCGSVGAGTDDQGRKRCHFKGECQHKQQPDNQGAANG